MMPEGCCYLFQAEQRTSSTRKLWLTETNPGVVCLCLHITLAAFSLLTPSPPSRLHVFMSSQLSSTSTLFHLFLWIPIRPSLLKQLTSFFIKSVIMPLSSLSSPRSQCYWLHYANVNQPRAQSYTADEIRHRHTRARKKKKTSFCFG